MTQTRGWNKTLILD